MAGSGVAGGAGGGVAGGAGGGVAGGGVAGGGVAGGTVAGGAVSGGTVAGIVGGIGIGAILGLASLGGDHGGKECTNMPCPSGHFADPVCSKCVPCPQNMYQSRAGGNFCMACPK